MKDLRTALIATSLLAGAFGSQGQIADRGKDLEARKTEILSAFDTDGEGRLSAGERDAARSARRQQQIARFMQDHDLNQSGGISLDELALAGATKMAEMKAKKLAEYDEDGDGSIAADEVRAVHDRIQSDRSEFRRSPRRPSRHGPGRRGRDAHGDRERKRPHLDHGDERPIHKKEIRTGGRQAALQATFFERHDLNQDHVITPEEIEAVDLEAIQQRAEVMLARLDRNEDGELTAEEVILRQGPDQAHDRSPKRGPRWLRAHRDHSNDGPGEWRPDSGAPEEPQSPRRRSHHRRVR